MRSDMSGDGVRYGRRLQVSQTLRRPDLVAGRGGAKSASPADIPTGTSIAAALGLARRLAKSPIPYIASIGPLLASGLLCAVLAGCGASQNPDSSGGSTGVDGGVGGGSCATPNQGCPCSDPGQTAACGEVVQNSGGYVTCSEGTRTCDNGTWGTCVGQYTTTKAAPSGGGLQIQGLNPSSPCVNDPCDPACNTFIDDPSGLEAGVDSGLTINEAGVSLTGEPVSTAACTSLIITPNTAPAKDLTVTSMAPSPNSVAYTASILPPSCFKGTPSFLWSIDQYDIAQMSSTRAS